jgi:hypothetical protein
MRGLRLRKRQSGSPFKKLGSEMVDNTVFKIVLTDHSRRHFAWAMGVSKELTNQVFK